VRSAESTTRHFLPRCRSQFVDSKTGAQCHAVQHRSVRTGKLVRSQRVAFDKRKQASQLLRRHLTSCVALFREQLRQVAAGDEKYVAILEVCGFHDLLVKWLHQDARCQLVLVVQPLRRSATKTDRRDAHALSELLWINPRSFAPR
jgi:formyltetrahydrofolate hydrolase